MSANHHTLNGRSRPLLEGTDRAGARSMFKAIGLTDDDLAKPIIGIANTWTEIGPCNFHLRRLAAKVKEGVRAAGGTPLEFNTVSISDGITMGTSGMKASLVSREIIADSIELEAVGNYFDGLIALDRLRQDHAGQHHGAGPRQYPQHDALRRFDCSRNLSGP